jgi:hypothetical protein
MGFSEGSSIFGDSDAALAQRLDGIAATGVGWLRLDVSWAGLEPARGTYAWGSVDRIVEAARERGLSVLGILDYTPAWARPAGTTQFAPPTDPQDFARFATAAATRYHTTVRAWEVWNEPNSPLFWSPAADSAAYVRLLVPAFQAIKAADPSATVLTGGTSPTASGGGWLSPVDFLNGVYAAGGGGSFDAVAHHPYNFPFMPLRVTTDFNDNAFAGVTPHLYSVMQAHQDGRKLIWGTEMGAPTIGARRPASLAAYLTQAYEGWTRWDFTGPLFWYSYRDAGFSGDPEDHFGLVRHDFTPKQPALDRFTQLMGPTS